MTERSGTTKEAESTVVGCVTCGGSAIELPPGISETDLAVAMVRAGWRRVIGGWRCPGCIEKEEAAESRAARRHG